MKQRIAITIAAVVLIVYDLTADVPEGIRTLWLVSAITVLAIIWGGPVVDSDQNSGQIADGSTEIPSIDASSQEPRGDEFWHVTPEVARASQIRPSDVVSHSENSVVC